MNIYLPNLRYYIIYTTWSYCKLFSLRAMLKQLLQERQLHLQPRTLITVHCLEGTTTYYAELCKKNWKKCLLTKSGYGEAEFDNSNWNAFDPVYFILLYRSSRSYTEMHHINKWRCKKSLDNRLLCKVY